MHFSSLNIDLFGLLAKV